MADFSSTIYRSLSDLGDTFSENRKRAVTGGIGKAIQAGDFDTATAKAFSLGDLSTGMMLLKMKQEQEAVQGYHGDVRRIYGQSPDSPKPQAMGGDPASAIASIESGGRYDALGPVTKTGDRAFGKYQVMGANLGPWTQEVLGRSLSPQEFLADSKAQDAVFQAKFGQYAQKYGPDGAARAWFAGEGGMNDLGRKDQLGTTVGAYANKFNNAMGGPQQAPGGAMALAPTGAPQPQIPTPGTPQPQQMAQARPAASPVSENPAFGQLGLVLKALSRPNLPAQYREQGKVILEHALKSMDLPDDVKKYAFYVRHEVDGGRTPLGPLEYKMKIAQAGAMAITNDMRGENAESKTLGEGAGKRANDTFSAAQSASKRLSNISRQEVLLNNLEQGKIQPARMNISAWAKSFGLDDATAEKLGLDPKRVGDAQALKALTNESVISMIGAGGFPANNFSDADRSFLENTVIQLGNDPRGNKILLETGRRIAQTDIEKGRAAHEFRRNPANKGKSYDDFELQWADKVAKEDKFGDLRKQAEELIGSQPPTKPAQAASKTISTKAEYDALPPNAEFIGPDGKPWKKP